MRSSSYYAHIKPTLGLFILLDLNPIASYIFSMRGHALLSPIFLGLLICSLVIRFGHAEEHLTPISDEQIEIDGDLTEWLMTRHSAEYLMRGSVAHIKDFRGELQVAFNKEWIYLAIEGEDDVLQIDKKRDLIELHFADSKRRRHRVFSLHIGDLIRDQSLKFLEKNRPIQGAIVRSRFIPISERGGRYTIEAKLPMSSLPWVFGAPVRLTAIFVDHDPDGDQSIYTTHLANRRGVTDEVTFSFGGARVFKSIYQIKGGQTIVELSHDWVGDDREELLVLTTAEIILFGHQVRRQSGYTRVVHGLPISASSTARIEGERRQTRLVISYQEETEEGMINREVRYRLKRGKLLRFKQQRRLK